MSRDDGLMRENMRACRDARARPSVHTRHRVVVASIVPRELCLSSMFAHGGGVGINLRRSELLTGGFGDGDHCAERKSGRPSAAWTGVISKYHWYLRSTFRTPDRLQ